MGKRIRFDMTNPAVRKLRNGMNLAQMAETTKGKEQVEAANAAIKIFSELVDEISSESAGRGVLEIALKNLRDAFPKEGYRAASITHMNKFTINAHRAAEILSGDSEQK